MTTLTRELVVATENKLLAAMKTSDVVVLDTLLHDDLLFMVPGGEIITKTMDLNAHHDGAIIIEKAERTIEQINIIEDTAVVTLVLDTKGTMLGQPIEGLFRYLRVWRLFNGKLKVIGGGCMAIG